MARIAFPHNFSIEKNLLEEGHTYVAGIDEVGRGPLAGPFVAAAVILNLKKIHELINNDVASEISDSYSKITDSKLISEKIRYQLALFIKNEAISYSIYEVSNAELDKIGMSNTTQTAFIKCIEMLAVKPTFVITDAFRIKNYSVEQQKNLIQGDKKSVTIAAASIIAKVHRDQIMTKEHNNYPEYDFINNKGYGTKKHLEALEKFGPCPLHRKSFAPISSSKKIPD